jgi:hypothetical protein
MPTRSGQISPAAAQAIPRITPPEMLPRLQSLLTTLAEIDIAHQGDIETVRSSTTEEWLKQTVIRRLEASHRRRRAPYLRQLEALEERIRTMAA